MIRARHLTNGISLLGLLLLVILPMLPALPAAEVEAEQPAEQPEIAIDADYTDTIHIIAKNYAAKVESKNDLISCIGPIKARPDDGLIFLSGDTALYLGLPSPETHSRASRISRVVNHIIVLRNLNEGFNASRMFDLSKFDAVILNAPEVSGGLTPQDIMVDLGEKIADFELHPELVPSKVIFLTSPNGDTAVKKVDVGKGLYKTVATFPRAGLSVAFYWLEDATMAIKVYNPKTNGKILALNSADDWTKCMSNENFARDIKADRLSAMILPSEAPEEMIKSAADAGVQRIVLYSYPEEEINTQTIGNPIEMMTTSDDVTIFNCKYPEMVLFWYQT